VARSGGGNPLAAPRGGKTRLTGRRPRSPAPSRLQVVGLGPVSSPKVKDGPIAGDGGYEQPAGNKRLKKARSCGTPPRPMTCTSLTTCAARDAAMTSIPSSPAVLTAPASRLSCPGRRRQTPALGAVCSAFHDFACSPADCSSPALAATLGRGRSRGGRSQAARRPIWTPPNSGPGSMVLLRSSDMSTPFS
jgi:hypothetical protein